VLVLSATLAAAMVVGLLAYAPSARADASCSDDGVFCVEKTASADQVQVGQPLTFTITHECKVEAGICAFTAQIRDTLPEGLVFSSVSVTGYSGPEVGNPPPPTCSESAGTVTCNNVIAFVDTEAGIDVPAVVTLKVIPGQCGTFANTATWEGAAQVSETFTVVQCPPPTKEECKKGGWSNPALGFPDQGTCVSAWNRQNRQ